MATMMENVTLTAPDISCGHCVATVQDAVGKLTGVASVEADEATKNIQVAFDPSRVSVDQIAATLSDAGYPVSR